MRFLGLTLLVLLAGCGSAAPPVAAPPVSTPPAPPAVSPSVSTSATPPEALRFTATTVDGKSFDGASLAGKPTVFWFWAAWCPKCRGDAAAVRDAQKALADKVNVVGVAGLGSGADAMKTFVSSYQLTGFPQLADDKGVLWKRFEVPSQHYYVILDASGNVIHRGPLSVDQLRQKLGG
jgi:peroxiredoxin